MVPTSVNGFFNIVLTENPSILSFTIFCKAEMCNNIFYAFSNKNFDFWTKIAPSASKILPKLAVFSKITIFSTFIWISKIPPGILEFGMGLILKKVVWSQRFSGFGKIWAGNWSKSSYFHNLKGNVYRRCYVIFIHDFHDQVFSVNSKDHRALY